MPDSTLSDKPFGTSANPMPIQQAATVSEIAEMAGVGTATVDRVLNNRAHVRDTTRQRVLQAKAAIETGNRSKARLQPWRIKVILPNQSGAATRYLATCLQELRKLGNATVECVTIKKSDPALLARNLVACSNQGIDAVLFYALDHPRVKTALEQLTKSGIPTLALLSGLHCPDTLGTISVDNRAAGRTAAYLMGRMTSKRGVVAIVTGGELYQVHQDREIGFRAAIRHGFPQIEKIITLFGHDKNPDNQKVVSEALAHYPNLQGVYNVGSGNNGIATALQEFKIDNDILFIGHNLTGNTKQLLMDGTMDIVLHMNVRAIAEQAVHTMVAHLEQQECVNNPLPIEIVTRENLVGTSPNR